MGVVFYEMLTGSLPFRGDSAVTVALKHVNEQPAEPAELVPGLPYSLNQIVLKALAKDPDLRYRSAAEFTADLVAARSGGPLLAAAYDRRSTAPWCSRRRPAPRAPPRAAPGRRRGGRRGRRGRRRECGRRPGKRRKRSPWPWIALAAFLGDRRRRRRADLALVFGGTTLTVPSVVGQVQAAATTQLRNKGFVVTAHDDYSDSFGVGLVTRQQPTANEKLAKGGTVDIWVSRGPATTILIDVTGWTPSRVAAYLAKYGLVGKQLSGTSATAPKGTVYKQSPAPGVTVKRGDTVSYWVSHGLPQVAVPDLSGDDQNGAASALQAVGLVGSFSQQTSTSVPAGQVASQNPAANTLVAKGSTVAVVISSGTPTPTQSPSPTSSGTRSPCPAS